MAKDSRKIVIVEDEAISAMDLQDSLEELGYDVVGVFNDGQTCIDAIGKLKPDLVLMDINLGEKSTMDGIETASVLSARFLTPVVYLTSYTDQEYVDRARATLPYGYLVKPYDDAVLQRTIDMAVGRADAERNLRLTRTWLESTIRCIADAVIATDVRHHVEFMNNAAERLTGWSEQEALGTHVSKVLDVYRGNEDSTEEVLSSAAFNLKEVRIYADYFLRPRDGETESIAVEISSSPIALDNSEYMGTVFAFRDVTEQRRQREALEHLAHHDGLTGLPNRVLFLDRLNTALHNAERTHKSFALLNMDLKDFKPVNDTYGHDVGDILLQGLARRLQQVVRKSDTVARFGGDEFVLLISNLNQPEDAGKVAEKIFDSLQTPFELGEDISVTIRANVGIAVFPLDGDTLSELLRRADMNMYRAKALGANKFLYSEEMNKRLRIQSTETKASESA